MMTNNHCHARIIDCPEFLGEFVIMARVSTAGGNMPVTCELENLQTTANTRKHRYTHEHACVLRAPRYTAASSEVLGDSMPSLPPIKELRPATASSKLPPSLRPIRELSPTVPHVCEIDINFSDAIQKCFQQLAIGRVRIGRRCHFLWHQYSDNF